MNWKGVIPAITTNFDAAGAIDHAALARHCEWLIRSGCTGIVCCGSLGEAATLSVDEKLAIAATCVPYMQRGLITRWLARDGRQCLPLA